MKKENLRSNFVYTRKRGIDTVPAIDSEHYTTESGIIRYRDISIFAEFKAGN